MEEGIAFVVENKKMLGFFPNELSSKSSFAFFEHKQIFIAIGKGSAWMCVLSSTRKLHFPSDFP